MSVGAGSIKRAARTANAAKEGVNPETLDVAKEGNLPKTEAVTKKEKAVKKPKSKTGNAGKASEKKAEKKPENVGRYATYGIGQELPTYLL